MPFALSLIALSGCETVEVVEPPPPEPEVVEVVEEVVEVEAPPAMGAMIVRLHKQSEDAMPHGAVATVTLEGAGGTHEQKIPKGVKLARFDAVEVGRYNLRVSVTSADVEVGTYSYFLDIGKGVGDVTVQIDYQRADLVVEAVVETVLKRRYTGMANFDTQGCLGEGAPSAPSSELDLWTDGDRLEFGFTHAQSGTLRFTGGLVSGSSALSALGTFELPDGASGAWELRELTETPRGALAVALAIDSPAHSCRTRLEYVGLPEDASASRTSGSRGAVASVEVVGHGQTHAVTLGSDQPLARFEALPVGSYDILVNVGNGARTVATHRESVMLGVNGAQVGTTFETEFQLPSAAPLAARDDYGPLANTYAGKSVVSSGSPECTGSIPLVDSTTLTLTAREKALTLKFDNFYGRVLDLSGLADERGDAFAASGTYQSSDNKTGTWVINHFSAPTAHTLVMSVAFANETDSCRANYLFAGVR